MRKFSLLLAALACLVVVGCNSGADAPDANKPADLEKMNSEGAAASQQTLPGEDGP